MKKPPLREMIEVVAHTHSGFIAPDLVIWKKRRYTVTKIVKRQRLGKWRERVLIDVLVSKRMELEFDYRDKTWLLLSLEPDPF
jgi:hypothetical protein